MHFIHCHHSHISPLRTVPDTLQLLRVRTAMGEGRRKQEVPMKWEEALRGGRQDWQKLESPSTLRGLSHALS